MNRTIVVALMILVMSGVARAQCTEANDKDMAEYKRKTEQQDAQGCSECALLALYFCSATYTTDPTDKKEVQYRINSIKKVIKDMGQPICCQKLLDKQPAWGTAAAGSTSGTAATPGATNPGQSTSNAVDAIVKGLGSDGLPAVDARTVAGVAAAGVAAGIIANEVQEFREAKEADAKFAAEYRELAKVSNANVHKEVDDNLASALLGSYVGIRSVQTVTPLYKYDFNNGASLKVEGNILKFTNPAKGVEKDLILVDNGNKGETKSINWPNIHLHVAPDESVFYIRSVVDKRPADVCRNCLPKSNVCATCHSEYLIDATSGEVLNTEVFPMAFQDYSRARFADGTAEFYTIILDVWMTSVPFAPKEERERRNSRVTYLDKKKEFDFRQRKYGFFDITEDYQHSSSQRNSVIERDGKRLLLQMGTNFNYTPAGGVDAMSSSFFQLSNASRISNPDAMVNELAGLAARTNGDLFFCDRNGRIGRLGSTDYDMEDPGLPAKMRSAMGASVLHGYDFVLEKRYASIHGTRHSQYGTMQAEKVGYEMVPELRFTPDEKNLVYIVKDSLFIIDPETLSVGKRFGLSAQPYNTFFAKENGRWVFHIMAFDDYMFPITKKYSVDKLLQADTRRKPKPKQAPAATQPNPAKSSLADELAKLKALFDQGALTQEEFNTAKKTLLNGGK